MPTGNFQSTAPGSGGGGGGGGKTQDEIDRAEFGPGSGWQPPSRPNYNTSDNPTGRPVRNPYNRHNKENPAYKNNPPPEFTRWQGKDAEQHSVSGLVQKDSQRNNNADSNSVTNSSGSEHSAAGVGIQQNSYQSPSGQVRWTKNGVMYILDPRTGRLRMRKLHQNSVRAPLGRQRSRGI